MMDINIVFLVGLPGSGKSHYVKNALNSRLVVASSDDYIQAYADANDISYNSAFPLKIKEADEYFHNQIREAGMTSQSLVIDRTNMSAKSRAKTMRFIKEQYSNSDNLIFEAIVFNIDAVTWINRLNSREGKTIGWNILSSMAESFDEPHIREGFNYIEFIERN